MIKLIASDIDGTLVKDGTSEIDTRMYDVIRRLKEKGIIFVGASGRQFTSMAKLFHPVSDDIYYITDNGAILRDKRQVYHMNVIEPTILHQLISDAKKLEGCDIMVCGKDAAYCEDTGEMFYWLRDSYRFNVEAVGDFRNLRDDIVKVSIYQKDRAEEIVNEWFGPKWRDTFRIASAGVMWMDIVYPEADKGSSLKVLQKMLGISKEETMAFGDNINDLGLLSAAEESYAIGSARDEVKAAAKHVAPPLSEYGVTKVLEDYLDSLD